MINSRSDLAKKRAIRVTALTEARSDDGMLALTLCQRFLLLRAAQEAWIQDPEKHWLPDAFREDLLGAMLRVDALSSFPEPLQAEVDAGFRKIKS
jgi:hypothetical protein